jgi:hypothetical protein
MSEESNGIVYEVVVKSTGVAYPMSEFILGGDEITIRFDAGLAEDGVTKLYGGETTFDNRKRDGILENDTFVARQIGTHLAADGHTKVEVTPTDVPSNPNDVAPSTEGAGLSAALAVSAPEGQVAEGAQTASQEASTETTTESTTGPATEVGTDEVTVA